MVLMLSSLMIGGWTIMRTKMPWLFVAFIFAYALYANWGW